MSDTELKEIPVQILRLEPHDVLLLRVPPEWFDEQRFLLESDVRRCLDAAERGNPICIISNNVDLAVVTK